MNNNNIEINSPNTHYVYVDPELNKKMTDLNNHPKRILIIKCEKYIDGVYYSLEAKEVL